MKVLFARTLNVFGKDSSLHCLKPLTRNGLNKVASPLILYVILLVSLCMFSLITYWMHPMKIVAAQKKQKRKQQSLWWRLVNRCNRLRIY